MSDDEITSLPLIGPAAARLADLYSLHRDLTYVTLTCRYLIAHPPSGDRDEDGHVVGRALWQSAVISYARCFDTGSGHITKGASRPEAPTDRLTPELFAFHDDVMSERNTFVAHRSDLKRERPHIVAVYDGSHLIDVRVILHTEVITRHDRAKRLAAVAEVIADQLGEQIRTLQASALAYIEQHPAEAQAARDADRPLSVPLPP